MEMPEKIGAYEIQALLGTGGMGTVYKACHETSGKVVALKVLPAELAREQRFLNRFRREIRALSELDHPNIARILDSSTEESDLHFYAMEFVEGLSLLDVLEREGSLPQVKITDFGIARMAEATRMTATGSILGTAEYMSPEQAEGRHVDHRSDVYSLGVVFYRMLAGRDPFTGKTAAEVLKHHRFSIPDNPKDYNSEISMNLAAIVMKMLAKEPGDRFDSMTALLRALEVVESSGLKTEVEARKVDESRRKQAAREGRIEAALAAGKWIALAVVCLAIFVYWYLHKPARQSVEQKYEQAVQSMEASADTEAKRILREILADTSPGDEFHSKAKKKLAFLNDKDQAADLGKMQVKAEVLSERYIKIINNLVAVQSYRVALTLLQKGDTQAGLKHLDAIVTLFGDTDYGEKARIMAQDVRAGKLPGAPTRPSKGAKKP